MLKPFEAVAGLVIVSITLLDVFDTVVAPGATQGWLRVAERVRRISHPAWQRLHRRGQGGPRISRAFAPFLLLTTFAAWMLLLLVGFSLLALAARNAYRPPVASFPQAVYAVGSALFTIGTGQPSVEGVARWVEVGAGACGLAVVTLAITYILQVQNGLHSRDAAFLKLSIAAGRPPTGLALLDTYAALGCRDELPELFRESRDWTAAVLHRQSTHPALTYFRSIST